MNVYGPNSLEIWCRHWLPYKIMGFFFSLFGKIHGTKRTAVINEHGKFFGRRKKILEREMEI